MEGYKERKKERKLRQQNYMNENDFEDLLNIQFFGKAKSCIKIEANTILIPITKIFTQIDLEQDMWTI